MPIYEYRCESCGEELEKLQRISDARLVDCPACGKPALRRLVSAAAFRLKGSGWYETDFKKGGKRNLAESSDKGGAAKTDSGGDNKADAPAPAGGETKGTTKTAVSEKKTGAA